MDRGLREEVEELWDIERGMMNPIHVKIQKNFS